MPDVEVTLVGCGPAGIAAAIQLKRQGIDPLIFEKAEIGGLLLNANRVENYPGFPEGISGPDLVELMRDHLRVLSIGVTQAEVRLIDLMDEGFLIETDKSRVTSRIVVVASGTKPRRLHGIEIPQGLRDKVSYDVWPVRRMLNRKVVVIGAGDAAFDFALTLAERNDVVVLNRGSRTRCLPLLRERACASPRIHYRANVTVVGLASREGERVEVRCHGPAGEEVVLADRLLIAIGREANLDFLSEGLAGMLRQEQDEGGLHLIGDVGSGSRRQTAIAVGEGVKAAMRIGQMLTGGSD